MGHHRAALCALISCGLLVAPAARAHRLQPPAWWLRQAACIRARESHNGLQSTNLYQFLASTWASVGGVGDPAEAPRSEQTYRTYLLWRRDGGSWREWTTARACGLT